MHLEAQGHKNYWILTQILGTGESMSLVWMFDCVRLA